MELSHMSCFYISIILTSSLDIFSVQKPKVSQLSLIVYEDFRRKNHEHFSQAPKFMFSCFTLMAKKVTN